MSWRSSSPPGNSYTLADRNRKFLEYLANKDPSATEKTLSVLFRHDYETYEYLGEMLRQLFGVEGKEREGTRGKTSRKPQQGGERGSGAKEVSTLRSSHLASTGHGVVLNGLFVDGIALARAAVLVAKVMGCPNWISALFS